MKLLRSLVLLSVSRAGRQCRARNTHTYPRLIHTISNNLPQWPSKRTITTTATPKPCTLRSETETKKESESLSTQVRLLMRHVPYPVAIITSTDPTPSTSASSGPDARFRGMTVSSFNTVTLTPKPIISFNVRRPSETLNALLTSHRFLVHLLAPNKAAASLARDFARGNQNLSVSSVKGEGSGFEFVPVPPSSVSLSSGYSVGEKGKEDGLALPMLRRKRQTDLNSGSGSKLGSQVEPEANSFPFIFECRLLPKSVAEVYDHTLVVGTIVRAITSSELSAIDDANTNATTNCTETSSKDLCLTYANTRFWEMGKEV